MFTTRGRCVQHRRESIEKRQDPMSETSKIGRRSLLRGSLAAAAVLPLSGALASCASSGNDNDNSQQGGTKSADNPFGMADNATVDAVIFNGGYGYDYVTFAAN